MRTLPLLTCVVLAWLTEIAGEYFVSLTVAPATGIPLQTPGLTRIPWELSRVSEPVFTDAGRIFFLEVQFLACWTALGIMMIASPIALVIIPLTACSLVD